jgi:hypothetical protein
MKTCLVAILVLVCALRRPISLDRGQKHGQIVAMACEERRIIFDYAEAYKAIYTLCVQKELRVPQGSCL